MKNKQQGFTLLEVLVAGFILFLVLTSATLIYRGAILSSMKAERSITVNGYLPLMMSEIQSIIRENNDSDQQKGAGNLAALQYKWQATVIEVGAAPSNYIPEFQSVVEYPKRYKLWQVSIHVTRKDYQKDYRYIEFSW